MTEEELFKSVIMTAKTFIERDPAYAKVSAQLLIYSIRKEVFGGDISTGKFRRNIKSISQSSSKRVSRLAF